MVTGAGTCHSCGTALRETARFCDGCGSPVAAIREAAEFKQVTVLFADLVHSMHLAEALGAERLREVLTELVDRAAKVVDRYGGTVDKFTGDGVMAPSVPRSHSRTTRPGVSGRAGHSKRVGVACRTGARA